MKTKKQATVKAEKHPKTIGVSMNAATAERLEQAIRGQQDIAAAAIFASND